MATNAPAEVFPPGEYIRDEIEARGWTQQDLADILGRPLATVNLIISGKRAVTPETARGLADAFGTSAEMWLALENAYQLGRVKTGSGDVSKRAKLYQMAPVSEMIRRGWIEPSNNVEVLEQHLKSFFETADLDKIPEISVAARKSTAYDSTTVGQRAWFFRAQKLARTVTAEAYSPQKLTAGLAQIRGMTVSPENMRMVSRVLSTWGVRFVALEVLQKSRIDGAAFWIDRSPAIALSLRFDRIDAFWHTLVHELIHIKYKDAAVIDSDLVSDPKGPPSSQGHNEIEDRANNEAAAILVPPDTLASFIASVKPMYSKAKIRQFAAAQGVHPGIVVGQLQRRAEIAYSHSREMLVPVREYLSGAALVDGFGNAIHNPQSKIRN